MVRPKKFNIRPFRLLQVHVTRMIPFDDSFRCDGGAEGGGYANPETRAAHVGRLKYCTFRSRILQCVG